ncbi:MAG: YihY/virulence factor BrkB family protein [Oscillospiraceae bacterium]|jgi:membrane protein|nr:YihY/virulence factor BrkB family protein [Oscillospiraceae bacterium]
MIRKRTGKLRRWLADTEKKLLSTRRLSIFYRFIRGIFESRMIGVAAQTAFFLLLSLFPMILALVSALSRLEFTIDREMLEFLMPASVYTLVEVVIEGAAAPAKLTIASIILSLWSASAGIWALMRGISILHSGGAPNIIRGRLTAAVMMVGFIVAIAVSISVWVFGKPLIILAASWLGIGEKIVALAGNLVTYVWIFGFILALYAFTPGVKIRMRNKLICAAFSTLSWALISLMFERYMDIFGGYSVLYGGVGTVLGLAMWLLVICTAILMGAYLNALLVELESVRADKAAESPK